MPKLAGRLSLPWLTLHIRSKVKITNRINAVAENRPYYQSGKAYQLQTWCRPTDEVQWPTLLTCAVTSEVKGQGYNVTSLVWCMFADNSTRKSCQDTEIGRKAVFATTDILYQFQGQKKGIQDALSSCSSHNLQGSGAYCGSRTVCL